MSVCAASACCSPEVLRDTCGEEACSLATGLTTGLAFPLERERPSEKLEKNNLL